MVAPWRQLFHQLLPSGIEPNLIYGFLTLFPTIVFGFIPKYWVSIEFWTFIKLVWDFEIFCSLSWWTILSTFTKRNPTKFDTWFPYTIVCDCFWIYSKIFNFSWVLDFFEAHLGLRNFTYPVVPGVDYFINFYLLDSNQIWYTPSLHYSLQLFLDLFQNIEFFLSFALL